MDRVSTKGNLAGGLAEPPHSERVGESPYSAGCGGHQLPSPLARGRIHVCSLVQNVTTLIWGAGRRGIVDINELNRTRTCFVYHELAESCCKRVSLRTRGVSRGYVF